MLHARARGGAAFVAAVALGLAACQSAPSNPSATPSVAPSEAPTLVPSPTPPDVSGAFKTAFAAMTSGVMNLSGQVRAGAVQFTLSGTSTFDGVDSQSTTITTISGVQTEVDAVATGGKRYVKTGAGPWLEDTSAAPSSSLSKELARVSALVVDAGPDTHDGLAVHKLTLPAGTVFDVSTLGLGAVGATNVQVTLAFYAKEDGTPSALTIDAGWSQPAGSGTVDVHVSLDIKLSGIGVHHPILAPDHVWSRFKSSRYALSIAYPDEFDYFKGKDYEIFNGPVGQYAGAGRFATRGYTLNAIASGTSASLKSGFHAKAVKNEALTLAGVKARILTVTGGYDSSKTKVVIYDVLAVKGAYCYEVYWVSAIGNEAADLATFKQILATFSFG